MAAARTHYCRASHSAPPCRHCASTPPLSVCHPYCHPLIPSSPHGYKKRRSSLSSNFFPVLSPLTKSLHKASTFCPLDRVSSAGHRSSLLSSKFGRAVPPSSIIGERLSAPLPFPNWIAPHPFPSSPVLQDPPEPPTDHRRTTTIEVCHRAARLHCPATSVRPWPHPLTDV
jgi:hypothetical protein